MISPGAIAGPTIAGGVVLGFEVIIVHSRTNTFLNVSSDIRSKYAAALASLLGNPLISSSVGTYIDINTK